MKYKFCVPSVVRGHSSPKRALSYLIFYILYFIFTLSLFSCQKADSTYYTGARVNFTFTYTNTVPELNAALGGFGEFCTVRLDGNNFLFSGLKSTTTRPLTAVDTRVHPALGLSGLILGRPNIPEPGADVARVVAFDLACPCYDDFSTTRNLQLQAGGMAYCSRCSRTYDLNNQGIVAKGDAGRALYRYRANFNSFGNTLSVSN